MPWFLAIAILVVPLIEIYVIVQIGQEIGAWPTIALLLVESALGAWLMKREGKRAWTALRTALDTGTMPGRELADGALVLIGGTLLLTPGFVSDVFGFFFVLPFTRPLARRALTGFVTKRLMVQYGMPVHGFDMGVRGKKPSGKGDDTPTPASGAVVEGEVVDGNPDGKTPDGKPVDGKLTGNPNGSNPDVGGTDERPQG